MSFRVATAVIAIWAIATGSAMAERSVHTNTHTISATQTAHQYTTEERALSDLSQGMSAFVLSPSQSSAVIQFTLPPNIDATEARLNLAARPGRGNGGGVIHVSINGGDIISINPDARSIEAKFALYSADLRPGQNTLSISYSTDTSTSGWIIDARRSQLRLTLDQIHPVSSLEDLEYTLAADFAAPRRIALITETSRQRATLESLVVQGIALRAGSVPLFTGDATNADLIIRIAENSRLSESDRAQLNSGLLSQGPEIAFSNSGTPRLIITGRNIDEAAAASRLFAARSFEGFDTIFVAADAVSANRLGMRQISDARDLIRQTADLRNFAASGLPFSADQGSRTAIQFSGNQDADRYGALSVLARASLASGEAWLYAWYGENSDPVPAGHNLLILGPGAIDHDLVKNNAPSELRSALRAAERSRGNRGLMRFAAAAYADAGSPETPLTTLGVASLFEDKSTGLWIGTLTAPDVASFEAAGRSLARSNLWASLEGRAAVWSERGVTPYNHELSAPSLRERAREFALDHTRDGAFVLFGFAFIFLFRGVRRRRRAQAAE